MAKHEKRCSTCSHWIRVNMPGDLGCCIPVTRITKGADCCDKYDLDPELKPKRKRRKESEDGKADS